MPNRSVRHITYPLLQQGLSIQEISRRTGFSEGAVGRHRIQLFGKQPQRFYDWKAIQKYYDEGHTPTECRRQFGFDCSLWGKAVKAGRLVIDPARKKFRRMISPGQRFTKLTTIKCLGSLPNRRGVQWLCRCDCGKEIEFPGAYLNCGTKKSCGCAGKPRGSKNAKWKGHGEIGAAFWHQIRDGAKSREIEFAISIEQIWDLFLKQERKCALSGEPLEIYALKGKVIRTASLDRIDSSKGYTLDNIQWVHKDVNQMKLDRTDKDFLDWINKIYHFQHVINPRQANLSCTQPQLAESRL